MLSNGGGRGRGGWFYNWINVLMYEKQYTSYSFNRQGQR
jgi:hypothetical protein